MSTINQRMAWKESRLLAPICIACLGLLGITLVAFQSIVYRPYDYVEFAGNLFMSLGCIVSLACGILMFVFEREAGTDTFLECFPVDGRQVARSKIVRTLIFFAIYIVVGLLFTGLALMIYFQGTISLEGKESPALWIATLVAIPTQCLLWTLVCSLSFRSGLWATITSTLLTLASVIILNSMIVGWSFEKSSATETSIVLGANLTVCAVLGVVIWNLGPTWLRGRERTTKARSNVMASKTTIAATTCAYPWRALFWQKLKQSWIPWLIGAVAMLFGCYLCHNAMHRHMGLYNGDIRVESLLPTQWLFIAAGAWIGMLMFSGDQANSNFLFFQQQTDYPRKVWLSRLGIPLLFLPVVWIAAILVWPDAQIFLWLNTQNAQNGGSVDTAQWRYQQLNSNSLTSLTVTFLAAAGIAQLTSMLFRTGSGVVSFAITAVLCFALFMWQREVSSRFGSLILFTGPIALVCFVATWWHAPRWISGRRKKTSALVAITSCGLITAATIGGWIWQRVNEFDVPVESLEWTAFANSSNPDAHRQKYPNAAALATAFNKIKDPETVSQDFPTNLSAEQLEAFFLDNEETIATISECLRADDCGLFLNPRSKTERERQKERLLDALRAVTLHHLESKNPEVAFDSLMDELRATWRVAVNPYQSRNVLEHIWDWTSNEGIDAELVRRAIKELSDEEALMFDVDCEVLYRESALAIERKLGNLEGQPRYPDLPWEVERSRRWNLNRISRPDDASPYWWLNHPKSMTPPDLRTPVVETMLNTNDSFYFLQLRNLLRYTRVRLALVGWKLENKQWPDSLDELAEGNKPWLNEPPLSIHSNQEFVYAAKGLDDRIFFSPEHHWRVGPNPSSEVISANQPFLLPWSGAIGRKRAFIEQLYDDETDVTRESSKTDFIYWIPPVQDESLRRNIESYILK